MEYQISISCLFPVLQGKSFLPLKDVLNCSGNFIAHVHDCLSPITTPLVT